MARPHKFKSRSRLNLIVEARNKKLASKMAFDRKISQGQLFEDLLVAEKARMDLAAVNGQGAAR